MDAVEPARPLGDSLAEALRAFALDGLPSGEELIAEEQRARREARAAWEEFDRDVTGMYRDARACGVSEKRLESLSLPALFRYRDLQHLRRQTRPTVAPHLPRQRGARPRARRAAARRASGLRSGQDPGNDDPEPAETPLAVVIPFPRRRPAGSDVGVGFPYSFTCISAEERGTVVA